VDGDAGREESGFGGPLLAYSWINGGGLVGSDGGDTTSDGWRPCNALW
jgi:hypothetical protein